MRPLAQPLLVALALGAAGLGYHHLRQSPPVEAPPTAASAAVASTREPEDPAISASTEPAAIEPASPAASAEARANAAARIAEAAARQDADALPELVRHLSSADPAVRGLALEGILQLGDAAGVEPLRAAARRARDPREAARLLEAADYLALPPAPPASGTYKTVSGIRERRAAPSPSRASPTF